MKGKMGGKDGMPCPCTSNSFAKMDCDVIVEGTCGA